MQPIAGRTLAAPRPRRIVIASSAIALLMSAHQNVRADDTTAANDIKLPDVTVQQAPAKRPPAVAQKAKDKKEAKPAAAATKPAQAVKPPSAATPEIAAASPPSDAPPASAPATGNPGTPSASVAKVSGASGAGAQAAAAADMTRFENAPVFSVADILREVPGVSLKQGNGPRDMGISIRGSNARNGFGIRNIVILDDGFPVTQPDGLSRSDLIDPHAYAGVDVWRGPSSALFGNYATGGAINFRTFPGGAIDGVEYGIDVGSFNYLNNYAIGGKRGENWEASVFTSDVRGDGYFGYSAFNTQTVNALMTWKPSSTDTFTFKFINNTIDTELPFRMSLNQFK
ncbi:MAG: TonB-dependent receptor plug domain-containing protein, partial [Hyphomicrobium sp.]|nr:TonB-dependent receptor plug domain-containing protein [Hyphomicrobium sp.]